MTAISRRRVLAIGGGAAVVAGAAGGAALIAIGAPRRRQLLYDVGVDRGPDGHVPPTAVAESSGQLNSAAMHRAVAWSLSMPARPVQGVVFCLHGKDADQRFAFDQIHLPDVVEFVKAPLAIASVDGGSDSYWHPRTDGTNALAMLLDEFVPFVQARTGCRRAALLGWSMGGYGALLAAESATEQFFAVAAASPALWTSPGATAPGAFDSAADYERFDVFGREQRLAPLTVRVDCGTGDPFYAAARRFVAGLARPAHGSFGPGFHEAAYWRSVAPAQITTIAAALPA